MFHILNARRMNTAFVKTCYFLRVLYEILHISSQIMYVDGNPAFVGRKIQTTLRFSSFSEKFVYFQNFLNWRAIWRVLWFKTSTTPSSSSRAAIPSYFKCLKVEGFVIIFTIIIEYSKAVFSFKTEIMSLKMCSLCSGG